MIVLEKTPARTAAQILAIIVIMGASLTFGTAARAQGHGYMRVVTSTGRQMAGESTTPAYNGWIPFSHGNMPSANEIAAIAQESNPSSGSVVHKPVVIVKERDKSSLGLLGVMASHQVLPEVDIVFTTTSDEPMVRYKLTGATVISIRAGDTNGDTEAPLEQLRFNYTKIEVVR